MEEGMNELEVMSMIMRGHVDKAARSDSEKDQKWAKEVYAMVDEIKEIAKKASDPAIVGISVLMILGDYADKIDLGS
jgi:hypothetical protein